MRNVRSHIRKECEVIEVHLADVQLTEVWVEDSVAAILSTRHARE